MSKIKITVTFELDKKKFKKDMTGLNNFCSMSEQAIDDGVITKKDAYSIDDLRDVLKVVEKELDEVKIPKMGINKLGFSNY